VDFSQIDLIALRADAGPENVFPSDYIEEDERTRFKLARDNFGSPSKK
jgi:hypothetical protein